MSAINPKPDQSLLLMPATSIAIIMTSRYIKIKQLKHPVKYMKYVDDNIIGNQRAMPFI